MPWSTLISTSKALTWGEKTPIFISMDQDIDDLEEPDLTHMELR